MQSKLADLNSKLRQNNLDGFIVTNQTNIFYLTGFKGISPQEQESILVFNLYPSKSVRQNSGRSGTTLITARLYQNEAKRVACRNLKIKIVPERHELMSYAAKLLKGCTRVGFEENDLRFAQYHFLQRSLRKTLMPFADLIENLRIIKTADEIQKIEKAQIISQKAYAAIIKTLKVGQTEEEVAERLAKIIKSLGGQGLAFESIVASGPNAGLPHYITDKKKIKSGEVLLFDFGAKYQNYCADLSRTIFIGKAKDHHRNIYYHVREAQLEVMTKIRSGVKLSDAYHFANYHFKKHSLNQYFLHGLGHGVGLEVHEKPHLRPSTQPSTQPRLGIARQAGVDSETLAEILQENMVSSLEPGLYFPWGGIRIEDLVVIKRGRAKVLGHKSQELIEIS